MTTPAAVDGPAPGSPAIMDLDDTNGNDTTRTHDRHGPAPDPHMSGEPSAEVRLSIPARPRFLRLARLTASGLAGDLGFPVDAVEDLRVAVDELAAAIIEGAPPTATLDLVYREVDAGLEVEGRCAAGAAPAPELHAVARELLGILADHYELGADGKVRTFRVRKHVEG